MRLAKPASHVTGTSGSNQPRTCEEPFIVRKPTLLGIVAVEAEAGVSRAARRPVMTTNLQRAGNDRKRHRGYPPLPSLKHGAEYSSTTAYSEGK